MKIKWNLTAVASAAALFLAGCGGGGGGASAPAVPSVSVSGTAATGLALASGTVTVKCAKGAGDATTDANGNYSLVISDAALPCMIQVKGEAGGTTVTLHSVAQAGTVNGTDTAAVANVTPLTEMIVAQLNGALPSDIFSTFGASSQVTPEQLNAATSAVITALKDATGIDLGSIDPFQSSLVAATASAPDQGNAYDKLLDAFGEKVPAQALEQVVNQIANAASNANGTGPVTLKDVMAAVQGGTLEGCPTAVSGKYRRMDYFGRTNVWQVDFSAMKVKSGDGLTELFTLTANPSQACQFTAMAIDGSAKLDVVMNGSGMGAYRGENLVSPAATPGFLFPVQAHSFTSIPGEWTFLQSGYLPGDGIDHFPGKLTVTADRGAAACDFDRSSFECVPDSAALNVADRADGGFNLQESSLVAANVYGYRAPNGALTLFGTTNPDGIRSDAQEQTSFVATKASKLALPAVGTASKYWDIVYSRSGASNITQPVAPDSTTVMSVDAATQTVVRQRGSDGRQDSVQWNHPVDGLRFRAAGTSFAAAYQFPIPGVGINLSINSNPSDPMTHAGHFYAVSVTRP